MVTMKSLAALVLLQQLDVVDAFWRMGCNTITTGRIDPIISPGKVSGHTHSIVGSVNIGVSSTNETLFNSQCTSCEISADRSAYWTPTLYYNYPNGTFVEVPHSGSVVYYLGRGPNVGSAIPFPPGIRFVSGNFAARSFDNTTMTWGNKQYPPRRQAEAVTFACLNSPTSPPEENYMKYTTCSNGLRAQIAFQSCWDGKNLYLPDQSHVAYLSSIDNGICPPTHPIQMPLLFMETLWSVANVPGQTPQGQFVFAQGDTTGYGFHGDFMNGWDHDVLANATANCLAGTNGGGQISACPILREYDSDAVGNNCPAKPPGIDEQYTGLLTKLPGCNKVTSGPANAIPSIDNSCPSNITAPTIASQVLLPALSTNLPAVGSSYPGLTSQIYLGCYNDTVGQKVRTLNAASISTSKANVTYCTNWCNSQGYRYTGLEYGQECHCDNAIKSTAINGQSGCSFDCKGSLALVSGPASTLDMCGGAQYISIYNNTSPSFIANGNSANSAGPVPVAPVTSPSGSEYLGCATDNLKNAGRALTGPSTANSNMTNTNCKAWCKSQGIGYQYYATEYSSQCFCGNSLQSPNYITNSSTSISPSICGMRCAGDNGQICGGGNALSLFKDSSYVPPSVKSPIGKYTAQACLTDPNRSTGRSLQGASWYANSMTQDQCVSFCSGKNMKYAGLEYGSQCYCGNSISANTGSQVDCDVGKLMVCGGDKTQWCGGPSLLTLYVSS